MPLEQGQLFWPWLNSCNSSYTLPRGLCLRLSKGLAQKCFCTCTHPTTSKKARKLVIDARYNLAQGDWKDTSVQGGKHKQARVCFMRLLCARQHNCCREESGWPLEGEKIYHPTSWKHGYPWLKKLLDVKHLGGQTGWSNVELQLRGRPRHFWTWKYLWERQAFGEEVSTNTA